MKPDPPACSCLVSTQTSAEWFTVVFHVPDSLSGSQPLAVVAVPLITITCCCSCSSLSLWCLYNTSKASRGELMQSFYNLCKSRFDENLSSLGNPGSSSSNRAEFEIRMMQQRMLKGVCCRTAVVGQAFASQKMENRWMCQVGWRKIQHLSLNKKSELKGLPIIPSQVLSLNQFPGYSFVQTPE